MHTGIHISSSTMRRRLLEAKKSLRSSFLLKKWRQKDENGQKTHTLDCKRLETKCCFKI